MQWSMSVTYRCTRGRTCSRRTGSRDLNIITFEFVDSHTVLYESTSIPDILVAEMMIDGSFVYLDTLCMDGVVVQDSRSYMRRPETQFMRPGLVIRESWTRVPTERDMATFGMPSDGIVCVTPFRTQRKKQPTIDLVCMNGYLCASMNSDLVPITFTCTSMVEQAIYELTVQMSPNVDMIRLTNPVERTSKKRPNNMDIVRRAFMSVSSDADMSTILFDVTSLSFRVRTRAYEMAQAAASSTRGVIVVFGAGRFQEWYQMKLGSFSYIAIDPNIDVAQLERNKNIKSIVPYDPNKGLSIQVSSMARRKGMLMYYKGRSEDFISSPDVLQTMQMMGIPGVFSFSISYHIQVLKELASWDIKVFGCGYVHDDMRDDVVGIDPVTMKVDNESDPNRSMVVSKFGKSTYIEPILLSSMIPNMYPIRTAIPNVWKDVDETTEAIMSRCVIMYSS
ncbi:hypothetical protein F5Y03DRAFT_44990 [Xylaria venustula]|nr:hypothetical protein F5Y03DRAFT_44990 [Xylaria venustula]